MARQTRATGFLSVAEELEFQRTSYGYTCGNLARNCTRFGVKVGGVVRDITGENPLTAAEKAICLMSKTEYVDHGSRVWDNVYKLSQCGKNGTQTIFCA